MFKGEKRICSITRWISPTEITYKPSYWYLWTIKTFIVIRMIHHFIENNKKICVVLFLKKADSKEKRNFLKYPKYISQYKISPEDRKKNYFDMF